MGLFSSFQRSIRKFRRTRKVLKRWSAFVREVRPALGYHRLPQPDVPNYNLLECWAAHPEKESKANWSPGKEEHSTIQNEMDADVFFLHPTTFFGPQSWNAPLDHAISNELVDELVMPGQASVFSGSCRIFAPRYRQATFFTFLGGGKNGRKALELAYQDVESAFEYYLKNYNQGRPFFIAGHSQGALHGFRLLEEKVEGTALQHQLIAAYVIGFRLPLDKFGKAFHFLHPCRSAIDTSCIIAWDTYWDKGKPWHRFDKAEIWYKGNNGNGRWVKRAWKKPLVINPLSWKDTPGKVSDEDNKGAIYVKFAGPGFNWNAMWGNVPVGLKAIALSEPCTGEVSAEIRDDGFLYISKPKTVRFRLMTMPGGNYHMQDFNLFYMNIRENILYRLEAYLKKNQVIENNSDPGY